MASSPTLTCGNSTCGTLAEATLLRRQADDLLQRLLADRESVERRLAETGKRDPIKTVTGTTALERAIASTRDMIADIDSMLREQGSAGTLQSSEAIPEAAESARRQPHNGSASRRRGGMLFAKRPLAASA